MAGVFQNMTPHPPHRPASDYLPPLVRGEDTLAGWRGGGWGVNILEDARHSSVLYVCKYFVVPPLSSAGLKSQRTTTPPGCSTSCRKLRWSMPGGSRLKKLALLLKWFHSFESGSSSSNKLRWSMPGGSRLKKRHCGGENVRSRSFIEIISQFLKSCDDPCLVAADWKKRHYLK
jgi:hypothetical protein